MILITLDLFLGKFCCNAETVSQEHIVQRARPTIATWRMYVLNRRSFVALPFVLAACKGSISVLELVGQTMGTTYSIKAVDHAKTVSESDLKTAIEGALAVTNASLSNWDAGSDVSRFNAGGAAPMVVSQPLYDVARTAEDVRLASGGAFDVSIAPLIEAWGFGAGGTLGATPSDAVIEAALAKTGQGGALTFGAGTLEKAHHESQLHLPGIGKGHGVDLVADAIRALGIEDFMVEIGGDLYAQGRNPDGLPWQIGVETPNPADARLQQIVALKGHGLATSGDYRNYFELGGQRYSHIIDPTTGAPVTHATASATVIAENAMQADAWSTAMLVLGHEKGMALALENDLAVLFIDRSDNGFAATPTPRFDALTA